MRRSTGTSRASSAASQEANPAGGGSYYIACFVRNCVPIIGLGVLTTLTDPLIGSTVFAATIAALGIGALVWRRFAVGGHPREQEAAQVT